MDAPDGSETTLLALMAAGLSVGAAVLAVRVLWWRWRELVAPPLPPAARVSRFDALAVTDASAARSAAWAASGPSALAGSTLPPSGSAAGIGLRRKSRRTPDWLETSPAAHPGTTDWATWGPTTKPQAAPGWVRQAFGATGADGDFADRVEGVDEGRGEAHGEGRSAACTTSRIPALTELHGSPTDRQQD